MRKPYLQPVVSILGLKVGQITQNETFGACSCNLYVLVCMHVCNSYKYTYVYIYIYALEFMRHCPFQRESLVGEVVAPPPNKY